jgi:N-succinyldiaminopimelate aminotransferase
MLSEESWHARLSTRCAAELAGGKTGGAAAWAELAALGRGEGVTNLGQGFPDFEGSSVARAAAAEAVMESALSNQYSAMGGVARLRGAIASWVDESYGWRPDAESEVVVSTSGTEALYSLTQALLGPGDSAIVFAPHFPWYVPHIRLAGATPIVIHLESPNFSCCDASVEAQLRAAFAQSPPPKCVFFNTPHNPTGHVATAEEIALLAELCVEHDCVAVADEVYEAFVAAPRTHLRLADAPRMRERTVTVGSASKLLSVTGWRVGWLVGPAPLIDAVRVMHGYSSFCAPTPLQIGTAAAIEDEVAAKVTSRVSGEPSASELGQNAVLLAGNAELLAPALERAGLLPSPCDGGYFLVADASPVAGGMTDVEFARHMVSTCKIMCMPLSLFGSDTKQCLVRFAICKKRETIESAVAKLAAFVAP